jgi:hypothetical protein
MKKTILSILAFSSLSINAQTFTFPINSNKTLLTGRNINVVGNTMVPVSISTHQGYGVGMPEKVAVSWYDASNNYGSQTKVRIYTTLEEYESNGAGTDYTGFTGVEALAYDNSIAGNLFVMETENAGGNLRVFDTGMNEVASYSAGDVGTVLGSGFNNARGMDFDNQNNVYIADDANNRIVKIENPTNVGSAVITEFLTLPNGSSPKSLTIANGIIYIACFDSKKILIYNMSTLTLMNEISTGTFSPLDLTVQKSYGMHIYASMIDLGASVGKVMAFDFNGISSQIYSDFGFTNGPWGLNCNTKGDLYCSDGSNGRFVKYVRTLLTGNDFESFTVDGQIGISTINLTNKTVNINVPNSYNMTMVNTHYSTSFRATATPFAYEYNLMPTDFSAGNSVQYTITSENGSSAIWNVYLNAEASISELQNDQITYFPNPVSTLLTIKNDKSNIEILEILDQYGQTIKSINSSNVIDCSEIQRGIYFIRVNKNECVKFIKL